MAKTNPLTFDDIEFIMQMLEKAEGKHYRSGRATAN